MRSWGPSNTVQIKKPPLRNRKKGGKEDEEAVQMAYCYHHSNAERKDKPHDRNDSANGVGKQGLPPNGHGNGARSHPTQPDRRAFGDVPNVGRTRTQNQYGHHRATS